jgi:hypothetical protein
VNRKVRGSAGALAAAAAIAAAAALWPMSANSLYANRARTLIGDFEQYAVSAKSPAKPTVPVAATFTHPHSASARCDACAEPPVAATDPSLFSLKGLDFTDAALLATDAGFDPGADFQDAPYVAFQASFEPDASAAPAAEISTAAMMTLGLAGLALTGRRFRRAAPQARRAPCPA